MGEKKQRTRFMLKTRQGKREQGEHFQNNVENLLKLVTCLQAHGAMISLLQLHLDPTLGLEQLSQLSLQDSGLCHLIRQRN